MFRRAFRVTLHLDETARAEFDSRIWNNLMALDFSVTNFFDKAGTAHGEWVGECTTWGGDPDTQILAGVRGVTAVEVDGLVERGHEHSSYDRLDRSGKKRLRRAA